MRGGGGERIGGRSGERGGSRGGSRGGERGGERSGVRSGERSGERGAGERSGERYRSGERCRRRGDGDLIHDKLSATCLECVTIRTDSFKFRRKSESMRHRNFLKMFNILVYFICT